MTGPFLTWAPTLILAAGALVTLSSSVERSPPLRIPLTTAIPVAIARYEGSDLFLSGDERGVAGTTAYLLRNYVAADTRLRPASLSLYIAYYDHQIQGRTIHSPKNCLPGAGWEPLTSSTALIAGPAGPATVNRYVIQNGKQRALVLYWYQGRGRIVANEYAVKWNLLRDSALRRRSDEALVRLVLPIADSEDRTHATAVQIAGVVATALERALPI